MLPSQQDIAAQRLQRIGMEHRCLRRHGVRAVSVLESGGNTDVMTAHVHPSRPEQEDAQESQQSEVSENALYGEFLHVGRGADSIQYVDPRMLLQIVVDVKCFKYQYFQHDAARGTMLWKTHHGRSGGAACLLTERRTWGWTP